MISYQISKMDKRETVKWLQLDLKINIEILEGLSETKAIEETRNIICALKSAIVAVNGETITNV